MADLQCKVCGKNIEIPDKAFTFHHFCGAEIVIPSNLTEERIEQFNLAYKYFRALDFAKATSVFEKILSAKKRGDYEAHWGLALCEFKIEYFENKVTKSIELYSHYTGNGMFTESENYKNAIKTTRVAVRKVYLDIGAKIDKIIATKKTVNEKRHKAYNLLSQEKFEDAEKVFNEILEKSSREPMAYIGKLLCELNFKDVSELANSEISLTQFKNYNNAIQCADKETKIFLNTYNMAVSERLNQTDEFPDEETIHTLDEMEITADDTFEITTADKAIGFLMRLRNAFFEIGIFFSEHAKGLKTLLISLAVLLVLCGSITVLALTVFGPTNYYKVGNEILQTGKIVEAAENLALAKDNPDAVELMKSDKFLAEIKTLYNNGKIRESVHLANLCGITATGIEKLDMLINETVSCGEHHSLAIMQNKTVSAVNTKKLINYGECNVSSWADIISVSAGTYHSVGLTSDGTVLAVGDNRFGQCAVTEWENIIAVSAGGRHTVGLKSDGTVVSTEYLGKNHSGQTDVSSWKNVIAISAGSDYTVGLLANGRVVTTKPMNGIDKWENIIAISAGSQHVLALTSDGKVLSVEKNIISDFGQSDVSDWKNIVKISAGNQHSLGLQADGKLLSTKYIGNDKNGLDKVDKWDKIIAFSAGLDSSFALTEKYQFISTEKTNIANWSYK